MAAISFTQNITRQNDLDTTASFGTIGGGPGAAILPEFAYQGTAAAARRINAANTDHGFTISEGTTRDTTTDAFQVFMFKGFLKQRGALNSAGIQLRLGSTTAAYHVWIMGDEGTIPAPGFEYPAVGGYLLKPVDATLRAWLNSTAGNPDETAVDIYAITANVSATANGEDLALDALDWVETGFYMVGGDGADTDGTFQDFVDEDEGQGSTTVDRVSLWVSRSGVFQFWGTHTIGSNASGTATATEFTDSFRTIVCPAGYVREGFNSLVFDLRNASTTIDLNNITVIGRGRFGNKILFDSANTSVVDTTNDQISGKTHGFETGEQVIYSQEAGTGTVVSLTGGESKLVTSTTGPYYYVINVNPTTFAVATSFANALAGTKAALTTATGTHSFTRTPDTRPDIVVTGNSGTITFESCTINGSRDITFTDGVSFNNGQIISSQKLYHSGGTIDGSVINSPTTWSGESYVITSTPEDISNTGFISGGEGHAIELTSAVSTGFTFAGNSFTSYGASGTTQAAIYNNSGKDVTINITNGGDSPTVRNGAGASTTIINAFTLTLTNVVDDSEVRIFDSGTINEVGGIESTSGGTFVYAYDYQPGTFVDIVVFKEEYVFNEPSGRILNYELTNSNSSIPINQLIDRNYLNP